MTRYRYEITDVWGPGAPTNLEVGSVIAETEYKGNGSYTWTIFDFQKGTVTGSFTGRYLGKVEATDK